LQLDLTPMQVAFHLRELRYGQFVHLASLTTSQFFLIKVPHCMTLGVLGITHLGRHLGIARPFSCGVTGGSDFEPCVSKTILQLSMCRRQAVVSLVSMQGAFLGHTGSNLSGVRCSSCFVPLRPVAQASILELLYVLLVMRHGGALLCCLDAKSLAHHVLTSEGFFSSIFDPLNQGGLLVQLLESLIALDLSLLVRMGLGYEHGTVTGYELLLLLHHLLSLGLTFL
jgi:hypothetical protein